MEPPAVPVARSGGITRVIDGRRASLGFHRPGHSGLRQVPAGASLAARDVEGPSADSRPAIHVASVGWPRVVTRPASTIRPLMPPSHEVPDPRESRLPERVQMLRPHGRRVRYARIHERPVPSGITLGDPEGETRQMDRPGPATKIPGGFLPGARQAHARQTEPRDGVVSYESPTGRLLRSRPGPSGSRSSRVPGL